MTTLDPRALEAAAEAVGRHIHYSRLSHNCHRCRRTAASAITAYLAVTQPIVETVAELEGLGDGCVIVDRDGNPLLRQIDETDAYWVRPADCEEWLSGHIPLPARVIWRPQP